jgi:hypothetical protein
VPYQAVLLILLLANVYFVYRFSDIWGPARRQPD